MSINSKSSLVLSLVLFAGAFTAVSAQDAPVPGGAGLINSAPAYNATPQSAPIPGPSGQPIVRRAGYGDLPLNADDAKARIVELTNLVSTSPPKDLSDRTDQLCVWLSDMIEAHNKMANAFAKHDQLKAQSNSERQAAQRFARLKNQAQLLKADLLIGMRRYPEALVPLVEIVIAEPTTETGKAAYKRLQDLGFSPEVAEVQEASPAMVVHQVPAPVYRAPTTPARKYAGLPLPKRTAALAAPHR